MRTGDQNDSNHVKILTSDFFLRLRIWVTERWPDHAKFSNLGYAGLIGVSGALICVFFRTLINGFEWVFTGRTGSLVHTALSLTWWQRLLVPTIGGLLAGVVLNYAQKYRQPETTTDYIEAIKVGNGRLPARLSLLRSLSSLFTISSGGSIGREGPMVQLAAMAASTFGHLLDLSVPRRRLFIACGAAAGIASAYKTPIAAALFVAEIILGSIEIESMGPLVFSSVISTIVTHQLLGSFPTYAVSGFAVVSKSEYLLYIILGVLAGLVAVLFLRLLRLSEKSFQLWTKSMIPRFVAGGFIVGLISIFNPMVWGNGYSVVNSILGQPWVWYSLLAILLLKIMATIAASGSGAVGGVLTPSLFVGAPLGELVGEAFHYFWPLTTAPANAYALVGMGCFLASTTQAPLMAILMIFEFTLQYEVIQLSICNQQRGCVSRSHLLA